MARTREKATPTPSSEEMWSVPGISRSDMLARFWRRMETRTKAPWCGTPSYSLTLYRATKILPTKPSRSRKAKG